MAQYLDGKSSIISLSLAKIESYKYNIHQIFDRVGSSSGILFHSFLGVARDSDAEIVARAMPVEGDIGNLEKIRAAQLLAHELRDAGRAGRRRRELDRLNDHA